MAYKCGRCKVKLGFGHARVGKTNILSGKPLCVDCTRAINLGEVPSPREEKRAVPSPRVEKRPVVEARPPDPAERLKRLEGLLEKGMLSREEYDRKRAEIIALL